MPLQKLARQVLLLEVVEEQVLPSTHCLFVLVTKEDVQSMSTLKLTRPGLILIKPNILESMKIHLPLSWGYVKGLKQIGNPFQTCLYNSFWSINKMAIITIVSQFAYAFLYCSNPFIVMHIIQYQISQQLNTFHVCTLQGVDNKALNFMIYSDTTFVRILVMLPMRCNFEEFFL